MSNKILNGYKAFVISKGFVKTVKVITSKDLERMNALKDDLIEKCIFSYSAYADYIDDLCNRFRIEICHECECYFFIDNLEECKCGELKCRKCECTKRLVSLLDDMDDIFYWLGDEEIG